VTRQHFDTVMNVLNATSHATVAAPRRHVGKGYADPLVYANAAIKDGVEKDPRFADVMEFVRLRALSDMYHLRLEERARQIAPEEFQAYYKERVADYEELSLRRITLPTNNSANLSKRGFKSEDAKRLAEVMRIRAAKGEDPGQASERGLQSPRYCSAY
jgi:hypothetical protein